MQITYSFKIAVVGLRTNKRRSILTILGIVIGITAIILMMSIGQGAQNMILGQIQGMGSRTISIEPGRETSSPSAFGDMFTDSLKDREVDALRNKSNAPHISRVTPVAFTTVPVTKENETLRSMVLGSSGFLAEIFDIQIARGSIFTDDEVKQKATVAVIGSTVAEKLFGNSNPIGEKIKLKNKNFRIVGVFEPKGNVSMFNIDETIFIPSSTMLEYILGMNFYHAIMVQVDDTANIEETMEDIKATIRDLHNITDPEKDDFKLITQAGAAEMVKTVTGVLTAFLVAVAAISLVVGGIGIMNIMLVSVAERTREIGLRKALGATSANIMNQFLTESIILTALGGLVGIILGAILSLIASMILSKVLATEWGFNFPVSAALLGLGVSALVGLVFGLYPARQAAKKSPIEALRYE
jgi:putative ABC transport system permease protein